MLSRVTDGARLIPAYSADGECGASVLHDQAGGAAGHGVLRAAQEEPSDQLPAPVPPHADAGVRLGGHQVAAERPRHLPGPAEHGGPRGDVQLLPAVRARASHGQVPLVEEVPDEDAAGAVRARVPAQRPDVLQRLQLSEADRGPAHLELIDLHVDVRHVLLRELREGPAYEARRVE